MYTFEVSFIKELAFIKWCLYRERLKVPLSFLTSLSLCLSLSFSLSLSLSLYHSLSLLFSFSLGLSNYGVNMLKRTVLTTHDPLIFPTSLVTTLHTKPLTQSTPTVKTLNKGHFGTTYFVPCRERLCLS